LTRADEPYKVRVAKQHEGWHLKIEHKRQSSSSRVALVILETDVERLLSDTDLLLIVDNGRGIRYDQARGSYDLTGESFGSPRHFGGYVDRNGDSCRVNVYID